MLLPPVVLLPLVSLLSLIPGCVAAAKTTTTMTTTTTTTPTFTFVQPRSYTNLIASMDLKLMWQTRNVPPQSTVQFNLMLDRSVVWGGRALRQPLEIMTIPDNNAEPRVAHLDWPTPPDLATSPNYFVMAQVYAVNGTLLTQARSERFQIMSPRTARKSDSS